MPPSGEGRTRTSLLVAGERKASIDALVTVRCLLRACQRKERGKGCVQLMASARWARSLHAIAGRKVSSKVRAIYVQQQGTGIASDG